MRKVLLSLTRPREVGSIAGISIYVDLTCLLSIVLWSLYLGSLNRDFHPNYGQSIGIIVGVALPISIFVHEFSRAMTAQHYQIPVQGVYCQGMGAIAKVEQTFTHPLQMLEVYFAGSLINFILFAILKLVNAFSLSLGGTWIVALSHIQEFNFVLAIFSLIPLIPLNGGYIFKALRWEWTRKQDALAGQDIYGVYIAGGIAIALGLIWQGQQPFLGIWMGYLGLMTCLRNILFEGSYLPLRTAVQTPARESVAPVTSLGPKSPSPRSMPTSLSSPAKVSIRSIDFSYLDAEFLSVTQPDPQFLLGMEATSEMRLQAAIATFNHILDNDPRNVAALHNRANASLQLGNKQAALSDFQAALHLQTDIPEIYLGKGNTHFALGDFQGAIMEYSEVLTLAPEDARAYFNRASAHVLNGSRTQAIADYQQAHTLFSAKVDQTQTCKIDRRLKILTA